MKSKPIIFNTEMVRALLDGRKTCMRRVIKPQPTGEYARAFLEKIAPYQPGDILYVRETWHKYTKRVGEGESCHLAEFYGYKASISNSEDAGQPWRSPACMPKEAVRIWLKITNVRVERLQEITEDGCIAEGVYPSRCKECNSAFGCDICPDEGYNEIDDFSEIWNRTIKKSDINRYGWDANPWVFVYEFERCEKPKKK